MKRIVFATAIFTFLIAVPALAQHGGGKPAGSPHVSPAPSASTAHPTTQTSRHATAASGKPSTMPTRSAPTAKATTTTKTTKTTTTATTKTTASTTTLSPVQQKLQRNTNLAGKLQSRLPAGTNVQTAASGFRNLGQFVAAVNVSRNLGIPFTALKTRMVDRHMSLGQAIQDARPSTTDATSIAVRAEHDADTQIRITQTTTTETTTTTTKRTKDHK
jgi:hypothetical protein